MGQICGKIPSDEDVGFIVQSALEMVRRRGAQWQGEIGEQIANDYATKLLGLTQQNFDKRINGFDSVFRDDKGKIVIIESKATKASGISALGYTQHGREGSVEWIDYKARLMCDNTSSLYSTANEKIGREILEVGAENVHFVIIHTDPETQKVDARQLR